jgi:alpha-tubulin suppressor-like RCC1 family protein
MFIQLLKKYTAILFFLNVVFLNQAFSQGKVVSWSNLLMPKGLKDVSQIVGGDDYNSGHYAIALKEDGSLVAWGSLANPARSKMPVNLQNVKSLAGGPLSCLALTNNGTVVAWGASWNGLNDVPANLNNVIAIAVGDNHALALKADGTVIAWGINNNGQTTLPQGLSNIKAIAAGGDQSIALKNDGTVICWGVNLNGPLSQNPNLAGIKEIAAGANHFVALKNDGTLLVRGVDWDKNTITPPNDLKNIKSIAAGGTQTIALHVDGTVVGFWESSSMGNWKGIASIHMAGEHIYGITAEGILAAGWPNLGQAEEDAETGIVQIGAGPTHSQTVGIDGQIENVGNIWDVPDIANIKQIALGRFFTVALNQNGRVSAFGGDWAGQKDIPVGLANVISVAAGEDHALALKSDGTVVGWGGKTHSETQLIVPSELRSPSTSKIKAIAAGTWFSAALRENGRIIVWGGTNWGENPKSNFSDGQDYMDHGSFLSFYAGNDLIAIAAGDRHIIALKSDGIVLAWGDNQADQRNVPEGLTGVVAIAAAGKHSLALKSDGRVVAWGDDPKVPDGLQGVRQIATSVYHSMALIGNAQMPELIVYGMESEDSNSPDLPPGSVVAWGDQNIGNPFNFKSIALGDNHKIALTNNGTIVAWGNNDYGQCSVPVGLSNTKAISAGENHSLALSNNGTVIAWGTNAEGQCSVPSNLGPCKEITAGKGFSAAIKNDGTIAIWGDLVYGLSQVPSDAVNIVSISAPTKGEHILALKSDGRVVAWGRNDSGQCNVPAGLTDVISIAAGGEGDVESGTGFSLALKKNGQVIAWGSNNDEQCSVPQALSNVQAISAGDDFGLALKRDGSVVPWGEIDLNNSSLKASSICAGNDEVGLISVNKNPIIFDSGTEKFKIAPENLEGIVQVASAGGHFLALKSDGTVAGWGHNDSGQVSIPANLKDVKMVAAGDDYSVALTVYGNVVYWGSSAEATANIPSNAVNLKTISAGNDFILAIKNDGTLLQWGDDFASPPSGSQKYLAVAAGSGRRGSRHALALTENRTVVAWGSNECGECDVPNNLTDVVSIAAGKNVSFALKSDGTVVSWGHPYYAEVPQGLTNVKAISCHYNQPIALKNDGSVVVWGRNRGGLTLNLPKGLKNVTAISSGENQIVSITGTAPTNPNYISWNWSLNQASPNFKKGDPFLLQADVNANSNLSYQWLKDGKPLKGETAPEISRQALSHQDAGSYSLQITAGSVKRTTEAIRVNIRQSGVLVYKLSGMQRVSNGNAEKTETLKGYVVMDTDAQTGAIITYGQSGSTKVYSIEQRTDMSLHSTGPRPGSRSIIVINSPYGEHPDIEQDMAWMSGRDSLIPLDKNHFIIAPSSMKGSSIRLSLQDVLEMEQFEGTLILDKQNSLYAQKNNETFDESLQRIGEFLESMGFESIKY